MANLTSVVYSSGALASTVTGTVSTVDALLATGLPITQGGNTAVVKPASTAPAAGDQALVVALSPNGLNPNGATLSAASAPVVIANDSTSIPTAFDTSKLYNGNAAAPLTPTYATLSVTAAGATTIVASVASKKIRVLAAVLTSSGTTNVKFQSHVTPTDLTGFFYEVANTGFVLPFNPVGWFQSNSGESLDINSSASIGVGGCIVYVAV